MDNCGFQVMWITHSCQLSSLAEVLGRNFEVKLGLMQTGKEIVHQKLMPRRWLCKG